MSKNPTGMISLLQATHFMSPADKVHPMYKIVIDKLMQGIRTEGNRLFSGIEKCDTAVKNPRTIEITAKTQPVVLNASCSPLL